MGIKFGVMESKEVVCIYRTVSFLMTFSEPLLLQPLLYDFLLVFHCIYVCDIVTYFPKFGEVT